MAVYNCAVDGEMQKHANIMHWSVFLCQAINEE